MNESTTSTASLVPVLVFLVITFSLTFGIQYHLISEGFRFDGDIVRHTPLPWLFLVMWVPGLAAFITVLLERSKGRITDALLLRIGSLGPYGLVVLLVPVLFGVMYGVSWLFGLAEPDFSMASLAQVAGSREDVTPDSVMQVYLPMSIFIGPFIHFLFTLGEEIGWRGFLLPRLMPYGKTTAYLVVGIFWGLWHAPIIWVGFNYPGHPLAGIGMMCLLTSAFGIFLNEMTLHYRSVLLAAFIHAAVNAQGFGVWQWVFPDVNPLLGGPTGLVGAAVWALAGIAAVYVFKRMR